MHQVSSKILECCDVIFKSKALLREHVLLNHRSGYSCRICKRNFCRKALLRRHLSVHNGQKDFRCAYCSYATSHKSNLERHQRIHSRQNSTCESTEERDFSDTEVVLKPSVQSSGSLCKKQHCQTNISKMHTKIVAKYHHLLNRSENLTKDVIFKKRDEQKRESDLQNRYNVEDDNTNRARTCIFEPVQDSEKTDDKIRTSAKRLITRPYKCGLCNRYFSNQNTQQVHNCIYIQHDLPDVPITCMISKGIPPEKKYQHL